MPKSCSPKALAIFSPSFDNIRHTPVTAAKDQRQESG
jgi:hypothetical protein